MTMAVTHTHDSPSAPPQIKALPRTFVASCEAGKAFSCCLSGLMRESSLNDPHYGGYLHPPLSRPTSWRSFRESPRTSSQQKSFLCLCAICPFLSNCVLIKTRVWGFGYGFTYRSIYLNRFLILNPWIGSWLFEVFLLVIVVWMPHVPLT